MRILYVTTTFPCPPSHGAKLRVFHIGKMLKDIGDVTLVVIRRFDVDDVEVEATKGSFDNVLILPATKKPSRSVLSKFRRMFDVQDVGCRHGSISENHRKELLNMVDDHDLVWFHTLTAADLTGVYCFPNSVVDLDDLSSDKFVLFTKTSNSYLVKIRMKWNASFWRRWERDVANRFSVTCVCSEEDQSIQSRHNNNVLVLPNGFELPHKAPTINHHSGERLGFIGVLQYPPNQDGLRWFIENVFPSILDTKPNTRLRVVGSLAETNDLIQHANVDYLGYIEDSFSEMRTWDASIVPLKVGGGTRIKILDSWSKMCPVISTSVGSYGIQFRDRHHLILADTPEKFALGCIELMTDADLRMKMAKAGWELFQQKYTWHTMIPIVHDVVAKALAVR